MKLFLSYSRKDQAHAETLVEGLRSAGYDLWFDEKLTCGAEWWQAILEQIRAADAFLAVVSNASLTSTACSREREYALALGKPVLPVLVEQMPTQMLPPDIAQRQIVKFTKADRDAFRLVGGIAAMPPSHVLPDTLPEPPGIPPLPDLAYIEEQVSAPSLTRDQQLIMVAKLREAIADEDDYDAAIKLAKQLKKRKDINVKINQPLQDIIDSTAPGVTVIKYITNGTSQQIKVVNHEDRNDTARTVHPAHTIDCHITIPRADSQRQFDHGSGSRKGPAHITISYVPPTYRHKVPNIYSTIGGYHTVEDSLPEFAVWQRGDYVRYSSDNSWQSGGSFVPGKSTVGGERKISVIGALPDPDLSFD